MRPTLSESESESELRVLGLSLGLDRSLARCDMVTAGSKGHDLKAQILEGAAFPWHMLFRNSVVNVSFGLQPSLSNRQSVMY